uniref:Trefoil factor 1 n=1 Tax=Otolemur garnettii TaxID=30611 RepID=H0XSV1_OTOGA
EATMEHKAICALVLVFSLALSTLAEGPTETCSMLPKERVNCGFPGVTASECQNKGCCFDSSVPGYPWCFTPKTIDRAQEDKTHESCPF